MTNEKPWHVQVKVNEVTYETIRRFDNEEQARAWMKHCKGIHPDRTYAIGVIYEK